MTRTPDRTDRPRAALADLWDRRCDQLAALLTRWAPGAARDRFVLVTGFHHTGTTLVQALLRRQGVFTFVDAGNGGYPDRPRELPLRHIHRIERAARRAGRAWAMTKQTTNSVDTVRRLALELRLLAPDCTLVVCRRDPAATALSLARRHGWDARRALADAETHQRVLQAWRRHAARHRGPVHFLALEDFSQQPERYLRRILRVAPGAPLPAPVETATGSGTGDRSAGAAALPDPREHEARRHVQSHRPVYPVDPDAWMATEEGEVLTVLRGIRERFGGGGADEAGDDRATSPR